MNDRQQHEAIASALRGALSCEDPEERDRGLAAVHAYSEIVLGPRRTRVRHLRLVTPALGALAAGLTAVPRQVRHHTASDLVVAGAAAGLVLAVVSPTPSGHPEAGPIPSPPTVAAPPAPQAAEGR